MEGQDFEVVIKEEEYKKLKATAAQLAQVQTQTDSKTHRIGQLQRELQVAKEENSFLEQAILTLGSEREKADAVSRVGDDQVGSGKYEVLGASIMYGTKIDPKNSFIKGGELIQKYEKHLIKVKEIEDHIQAQEQIITQLNNSHAQNQKAAKQQAAQELLQSLSLGGHKINNVDELRKALDEGKKQKETIHQQSRLREEQDSKVAIMIQEIERLNQALSQRTKSEQKVKAECKKVNDELASKKKDLELMKKDLMKVVEQLKRTATELTDTRKELDEIRKKAEAKQGSSELSKGDRPYRIKVLIDEHLSDMKKELCGMGDLSEKQVHQLLTSELQSLNDYILKAIKRNTN